jgi:hypothetical protein
MIFYVKVSAFKPLTEEHFQLNVYHVTSEQNLGNKMMLKISKFISLCH